MYNVIRPCNAVNPFVPGAGIQSNSRNLTLR